MQGIDPIIVGTEDAVCPWCRSAGIMTRHYLLEDVLGFTVRGGVVLKCAGCGALSRRVSLLIRIVWSVLMTGLGAVLCVALFFALRALGTVVFNFNFDASELGLGGALVAICGVAIWTILKVGRGMIRLMGGSLARVSPGGATGF